jgi:asparagine synthetase A
MWKGSNTELLNNVTFPLQTAHVWTHHKHSEFPHQIQGLITKQSHFNDKYLSYNIHHACTDLKHPKLFRVPNPLTVIPKHTQRHISFTTKHKIMHLNNSAKSNACLEITHSLKTWKVQTITT